MDLIIVDDRTTQREARSSYVKFGTKMSCEHILRTVKYSFEFTMLALGATKEFLELSCGIRVDSWHREKTDVLAKKRNHASKAVRKFLRRISLRQDKELSNFHGQYWPCFTRSRLVAAASQGRRSAPPPCSH